MNNQRTFSRHASSLIPTSAVLDDIFLSPVWGALRADPFHSVRSVGRIDLVGFLRAHEDRLIRSRSVLSPEKIERAAPPFPQLEEERLLFRMAGKNFVEIRSHGVVAYAPTREKAIQLVEKISTEYGVNIDSERTGTFFLLSNRWNGPEAIPVSFGPEKFIDDDSLNLHYGEGFNEWSKALLARLKERNTGAVLLHGPAGTGKTTFLRQILYRLAQTHRFYLLSARHFDMLTTPQMVEFWMEQQEIHGSRKCGIIVEDADSLVLRRDTAQDDHVSSILSISDGLLGDYLSHQMFFTVNAGTHQIDPALLRPGRLLDWREFGELDRAQGQRLAARLKRRVKDAETYTLADIYHADDAIESLVTQRQIGFAITENLR
jgi:hypothetical protein